MAKKKSYTLQHQDTSRGNWLKFFKLNNVIKFFLSSGYYTDVHIKANYSTITTNNSVINVDLIDVGNVSNYKHKDASLNL